MTQRNHSRVHWLLNALTDDDLKELASEISERSYASGTTILVEGEPGSEAFVVLKGTSKFTRALKMTVMC